MQAEALGIADNGTQLLDLNTENDDISPLVSSTNIRHIDSNRKKNRAVLLVIFVSCPCIWLCSHYKYFAAEHIPLQCRSFPPLTFRNYVKGD
jgi:hypothetical protein